MSARLVALSCLAILLGIGCRGSSTEHAAPSATVTASPALLPAARKDTSLRTVAPAARESAEPPAIIPATGDKAKADDELQSEEREANPTSESVTLTLAVSPPVKASVMWGAKQLARVTPDKPTIELQRPRSSGPLDLEIRAEGFLPHHTRLYSDRSDKVNVRLVRPADASGLLGFRSSTSAAAAKAKTK